MFRIQVGICLLPTTLIVKVVYLTYYTSGYECG